MEKLQQYIENVISDVCKSENRENDVKYQYCIIHNVCILVIKTRYSRVKRKIYNKLARERLFETKFNIAYNRHFNVDDRIDFNYSFTKWNVFGKEMYISVYHDYPRYRELLNPVVQEYGRHSLHIEKLKDMCKDYSTLTWDEYSHMYELMYGKKMYEVEETITNWG